jgi:hypothetical protein
MVLISVLTMLAGVITLFVFVAQLGGLPAVMILISISIIAVGFLTFAQLVNL